MKTRKPKFGSEYAEQMKNQYSEKVVDSDKVYNKKDRQKNKVRNWKDNKED